MGVEVYWVLLRQMVMEGYQLHGADLMQGVLMNVMVYPEEILRVQLCHHALPAE